MTFLKKEPYKSPSPLPQKTAPVKTWQFEVNSPFQANAEPAKWVNFYGTNNDFVAYTPEAISTGLNVHPELRNNFKVRQNYSTYLTWLERTLS